FGAAGRPITLGQTLATTVGQTYTINFWLDQTLTPNGPYVNSFVAVFGTNALTSLSDAASQPYTDYTFTEKATSTSTLLEFSFQNDAGFWDLDDVSVTAGKVVPEPASLLLIAPGLAALYFFRKRRVA
ncbi:MAG: PEP-CTERM sorting domain-containing protein, partial [Bryobacteraceae bacterium]